MTLQDLIERAMAADFSDIPEDKQHALENTLGKPGIDKDSVSFLFSLISQIRPTRALEVGLAHGTSASCLTLATAETLSRFDVIDLYQGWRFKHVGLENLKRTLAEPLGVLFFHETASHFALPLLLAEKRSYDYIFIDGDHRFDAVMLDIYYADRLLDVGGFLVLDDRVWPTVGGVVSFMMKNYRHYEYNLTHPRLTVCTKTRADDRDWYDFWHFAVPRNASIEAKIEELRRTRSKA